MASSGIRLGAWDYLKWGHISPLKRERWNRASTKIIVYAGEDEQYFSYISSEAWQAVTSWIAYRQQSGESISDDGWVMRDMWDARQAQGRGLVTRPKKLFLTWNQETDGKGIWAQGLRKKLEPGKKRHPYQANHSLRNGSRRAVKLLA